MISLGQASNLRLGQVFRHLFAFGNSQDSEKLRQDLAKKYGVTSGNVALYHTGRSALCAALKSVAQGEKLPVILPGLTCIAVVRAIKAAGCTPVFVDITPDTLEYNYDKLEQKMQELTGVEDNEGKKSLDTENKVCYNRSIILVQNTLGISWQASKIENLAEKYHFDIVEDLAHSAGRFYPDGREVGTIGVASALSFGKGKAIDTTSGGAVILKNELKPMQPSQNPHLSDRLRDRWYPFFGLISRIWWPLGRLFMCALVKIHFVQRSADAVLDLDCKLTNWQAKLARKQLENLPKTPLRDFKLVEKRDELLKELLQHGYNFEETWYDTPVPPKRYGKEVDFPSEECPKTVKISQQIINLPTWYSEKKLAKAREIIEKYIEKEHAE